MRISEARFFIIAAALHGALPVAAVIAPTQVIEAPSDPIEVAIEVEVETPPAPRPDVAAARVEPRPTGTEEPPRTEPLAAPIERPASPSNVEPGPLPTSAPNVEPPASSEPTAPTAPTAPAPTGTSEYDGPPPSVPTGPLVGGGLPGMGSGAWSSIPGVVPDMGRPAPAPTVSPKATVDPKIATKVITDAMKEKDKGLGLDLPAGGTVASSVRDAVKASEAPPESRATFEVRLSPTGQVLSVRVASSSGGTSDTWARAAKIAQAALAGRALTMTASYAKGAVVYVNVQSLLTLPDGSKSAIERKGAGATFDLSNIGAHMQRVVRSSFSVVAVQ